MTGNRQELPGSYRRFEIANPVVAQSETGNNRDCQDLRIANPLVADSSPCRPYQFRCRSELTGHRAAGSPEITAKYGRVGDNRETHAPRHAGEMSVGGHILEPCQLSILATVFSGSFCAPEGCWRILSCATILTF